MKFAVAIAEEALPAEPVLFRGNILESMSKAKDMGYDAVEIHTRDAAILDADAICAHSEKIGLRVSALATGMAKRVDGLTFISDEADIRAKAVERVRGFMDLASRLGAGIIIGSLRGVIPDMDNREVYDKRFYDCVGGLIDDAAKKRVNILLEVINRYENNYMNTVAETLEYIKPLASDNVKLHIDTFHMNIEETNMADAIRASGSALGYIHVADNTRLWVGSGAIDFGAVFKALQDVGYTGYVSVECLARPDGDTAARKSIETMDKIYKRL